MILTLYSIVIYVLCNVYNKSFVFLSPLIGYGAVYQVQSPNGKLNVKFNINDKCIIYEVSDDRVCLLTSSELGLNVNNVSYSSANFKKNSGVKAFENKLSPEVHLKWSAIEEKYNEDVLMFNDATCLRVRVYDDAVAFRWETNSNEKELFVNNETFTLNFANKKLSAWMPKPNVEMKEYDKEFSYFSHHECMYTYKPLSKTYNDPFSAPLLVNLGGSKVMMITDVNVEHYPGLWMSGGQSRFKAVSPKYPKTEKLFGSRSVKVVEREAYLAKVPGKGHMPWRVIMVTDGKGLLETSTLYSLADENRIGDTSWIKPGKVSWEWWNHCGLENVDFEPGVNQKAYMHYIDFAAENGIPYVLMDEGWSNSKVERFLEVVPEIDMSKLIEYANSKGGGILLLTTSTSLAHHFDRAFDTFEKWGIAGIKMDFMQRDDQIMNEFCYKVAAEAAKRKLVVDFHGGAKPTGMTRTFPNVLSQESVRGMEQSLWNTKANPDMAVMNAFIRMSVGPMDYTPGAMVNMTAENFVPGKKTDYKTMGSLGTRCQQLAMYVVYTSPLQMLCDSPSRYRKNPTSLDFLREVPTVWDETVAIQAEPCKYLAVARRSGDRWFIGAMTDSNEREITLDFYFLKNGKKYKMKSWSDGKNANVDATDNEVKETTIDKNTKISVKLAKGGGFAAIITSL